MIIKRHCGLLLALGLAALLAGCATSEETTQLRGSMGSIYGELQQYQSQTTKRLSDLAREDEGIRKQLVGVHAAVESRDDKIRTILGKLDELDYQLRTYWNETRAGFAELKKDVAELRKGLAEASQAMAQARREPPKPPEPSYEAAYKEAFDAFQKKDYMKAVELFSAFLQRHAATPLAPNGHYWLGESYMSLKNYDKAIVSFEEVVEQYPKSDKVPRALLSQADAFFMADDKKSSMTVLKKIMELFPKSEEAAIAERKLRALGF